MTRASSSRPRTRVVARTLLRPTMPTILFMAVALLALLVSSLAAPIARGQGPALDPLLSRRLPDASSTKNPSLALASDALFIGAPNKEQDAAIWQAPVAQAPFDMPTVIGTASGTPDYSPVSVAAADDGSVYAAYIDQENKTFELRRFADGQWGPKRTVQPPSFEFRVDLTVGTAGNTVFVFWRSPDAPFSYVTSNDGGITWTPRRPVIDWGVAYGGALSFAEGEDGSVYVAYTGAIDDGLKILVARWNGHRFVDHTVIQRPGRFCAGQDIVVQANGEPMVSWREVEGGVYIATHGPAGWHTQQLVDAGAIGYTALTRDAAGTIAAYWISDYTGATELYGALKPVDGDWVGPVRAGNDRFFITNMRADGFVHTASEAFTGSTLTTRYVQFAAAGIPADISARPVLDNGAAISARDTLPIAFAEATGPVDEFRWSWGDTPLAEAQWFPFSPDANLAPPSALLQVAVDRCTPATISTQVRSATGAMQQEPAATSILLDRGAQAQASLHNAALGEDDASSVVTTTLRLDGSRECSAISYVAVRLAASGLAASQVAMPTPLELGPFEAGSSHAVDVVLPANEDVYTATVTIIDEHGFTATRHDRIDMDMTAPVVMTDTGTISLTANPLATARSTLHISGTHVRDWFMGADTAHAEERIWGLAITAQRLSPEPETTKPGPAWILPFHAVDVWYDAETGDEVIALDRAIPLERLMAPGELVAGNYQITLQVLDDAGNASAPFTTLDMTLDTVTYPPAYLPLVQR